MIIPRETCSGLCDRIAVQSQLIAASLDAAGVRGGGDAFTRVSAPGIYEVERDFITPGREWEVSLSGLSTWPLLPRMAALINAFDNHANAAGGVTFSTLLTNSGITVPWDFAEVYRAVRNTSLPASQVFATWDIAMGQITWGGASWAFVDGATLGTGSGTYSASNLAPQQLLAYLGSGVTVDTTVAVTVSGLDAAGNAMYRTVQFTSGDPANTHKAIGAAADRFLDVTNIAATGSPSGTPTVFVRQLRERVPAL